MWYFSVPAASEKARNKRKKMTQRRIAESDSDSESDGNEVQCTGTKSSEGLCLHFLGDVIVID